MLARRQDATGCKSCGATLTGPRLELGSLPACNRFLPVDAAAETHPLAMAECGSCGLIQLTAYPPAEFVVPRVPWIRYREPDGHLDDLVALLPSLPRPARAIGVGPFDAPLIERLGRHGSDRALLDLLGLGASGRHGRYPYLETLQACLPALDPAAGCGTADLVVCRYLLEHSHDPVAALTGLKRLLGPEGRLVIEVPDSEKFLGRTDYSFVWEEHICYFSKATLRRLAAQAGFLVSQLVRYEGALEDALVAVLESSDEVVDTSAGAGGPSRLFGAYVANFATVRDAWHARLEKLASGGRKIAVFGVGHQAIMFVNALGLQHYVSRLADDQAEKQGYFAPGIAPPIVSSAALAADPTVGSWLLAVGPRSQAELRTKFAALLERGLRMYSIFPGSDPTGTKTP